MILCPAAARTGRRSPCNGLVGPNDPAGRRAILGTEDEARPEAHDQMAKELKGRVALVTGAARGIGAATARQLAVDGAAVVLTDVIDDEGEALAAAITASGGTASYVRLDVSREAAWKRVVAHTVREFGRLDVLVNNAGIGTFPDVEQETIEGWNRLIGINETGVWLGMRAAVPRMRKAGGGSIINVSSIFGAVGGFGASIAYHASKGAVRLMTKNAAIRYAKEGIRVNSVHPGFIDTPIVAVVKGTDTETLILNNTPMGRMGRSEEVAEVIAFLASDRASYMTGSEVYVDGGWTAQ
jgi:NAD(P)-dependent dehydrogenase (short-subunit alcohol dehydrogenase family)